MNVWLLKFWIKIGEKQNFKLNKYWIRKNPFSKRDNDCYLNWSHLQTVIHTKGYISERLIETDDPISWWSAQVGRWPDLARFAIKILSISAMSDEAERIFSEARQTMPYDRESLKPAMIKALKCTKHFLVGQRVPKQPKQPKHSE